MEYLETREGFWLLSLFSGVKVLLNLLARDRPVTEGVVLHE